MAENISPATLENLARRTEALFATGVVDNKAGLRVSYAGYDQSNRGGRLASISDGDSTATLMYRAAPLEEAHDFILVGEWEDPDVTVTDLFSGVQKPLQEVELKSGTVTSITRRERPLDPVTRYSQLLTKLEESVPQTLVS